jgi:exonuclease VII large subunit
LASAVIHQTRQEARSCYQNAQSLIQQQLESSKNTTQNCWQASNQSFQLNLSRFQSSFELVNAQIWLHDPQNILAKGYAMIWQDQELKEKTTEIDQTRPIKIQMQDGEVEVGK